MVESLALHIVSIVVVILLILSMFLTKRVHYFFSGTVLLILGILPILREYGVIGIDINEFPIVNFVIYFLILLAGKDLLKEGIKEEREILKYPSIILGVVLIALTTIPTLNKLHVIEFVLEYPPIVDSVLYIISGIFLIIGVFTIFARAD